MRLADLTGADREAQERFSVRFWSKVDVRGADECWPWKACCCGHGKARLDYGRFGIGGSRTMTAHRVAYILTYGEISDELFACHECDNPPCCNPAHLFAGTGKQNAADRDQKGRYVQGEVAKGADSARSVLSIIEAVEALRLVFHHGFSRRAVARNFGINHSVIEKLAAEKTYPDAWAIFLDGEGDDLAAQASCLERGMR